MKRPDDLIVAVAADIVEAAQALDMPIDAVAYEASEYARHIRRAARAAALREAKEA